MSRILSIILITSFLSLGFVDFFHSQFHDNEIHTTQNKSESGPKNTLPLDDHCNFQKCLNFISKINGLKNSLTFQLSQISIVAELFFNNSAFVNISFSNSNISARGPPNFKL